MNNQTKNQRIRKRRPQRELCSFRLQEKGWCKNKSIQFIRSRSATLPVMFARSEKKKELFKEN